MFRAKLRTLVCKPPVNCSVTHKPLDNKNNGTCYDCYQFVIKRLIEIAETRINTGFFKQLDLFYHITIPGLVPTIVLLTTLAMGNVLNAGFDQVFNMYNQLVIETGDIIDTYVYRVGITNMQFSLATAAGLFKSVVSFVLVVTSYVCAYKFADYKIF